MYKFNRIEDNSTVPIDFDWYSECGKEWKKECKIRRLEEDPKSEDTLEITKII